jgi:long-chain acyl-CoA synthetase
VVLRPETPMTEGEIIQFCKGRLGGFQRPRSVDFVDELPRTTLGKVRKRELREPYWAGQVLSVAGA